jgi:hypothetical protein
MAKARGIEKVAKDNRTSSHPTPEIKKKKRRIPTKKAPKSNNSLFI